MGYNSVHLRKDTTAVNSSYLQLWSIAQESCQHRRVLVAYIDESGNTGDPANGGSMTFALGCVLVDADNRPTAFDGLLSF